MTSMETMSPNVLSLLFTAVRTFWCRFPKLQFQQDDVVKARHCLSTEWRLHRRRGILRLGDSDLTWIPRKTAYPPLWGKFCFVFYPGL